jgi:cobalt-zinc-cadmium efflux system outer membrane protein
MPRKPINRVLGWLVASLCLAGLVSPARAQSLRQPESIRVSYETEPRVAARWMPRETPPLPDHSPPAEEVPAGNAAATGYTLAQLESFALANNPAVLQAAARVQAAEGRALQAGLYPNPVAGYKADEMGDDGAAGKQGAFVRQEIVTAHKLRYGQSAAGHAVTAAQHAAAAQQQRVLGDVRRLFLEALAAQRLQELNRELVRVGEEGMRATTELLRAKEVSRVDQLEAQIEADAARLRLRQADERYRAAWRQLVAVIGMTDLQPGPLQGSLEEQVPELDWDTSLQRLMAESPQLAQAQAAVAQARCALAREQAGRIGNLEFEVSAAHDNATGDNIAGVQVGMPLPVFDRNQGNICRAVADLRAAQCEVERIALELRERLAGAFERYTNARHEAEQYRTSILPNARTSLNLVRAGYTQGELGYLALLTAQRTYFQANLTYLEALRQLRTSQAEIESLLLQGGLEGRPVSGD